MERFIRAALSLALVTAVAACSDGSPSGPAKTQPNAPAGMVVSNALASSASASAFGVTNSLAVAGSTVAYVSAVPGTFPQAVAVAIRNVSNGGTSRSAKVIDGGFDPVGIVAEGGDELSLAFTIVGGEAMVVSVRVPARRPPGVVRTSPSKGRTDVALNVQVEVVFSEPVDPASVTASSFALRRDGIVVSGKVQVSTDGLSATLIPDALLDLRTNYSLTIAADIRDLDGDSLGEAYVVTFTTSVETIAGTPPAAPGVPEAAIVQIMPGQIAFLDPWEGAIFVADSTGRRIQRVSQTAGALDLAVSPDGKNIAFSKYCDSTQSCRQMYVISVDGIDPLLLQTGDTRDHPAHPTWSPDGKLIAFAQQGIGTTADQIFSINADGTGVTQLTHSGYSGYPEWSPDGNKILLTHSEDAPPGGLRYGIYEMDSDGSNLHGLLSGFRDSWPTWSPDGSHIAFIDLNPESFVFSLVVINADGSNATTLKTSPDWTSAARPAWSPDGKRVTFIIPSASRMCEDIWDFGMVPCGLSAKRVGLDGVIDPGWELPSASYVVWQR